MKRQVPMAAIALLNTRRTEPWPTGVELTDDFAPYDLLIGREGYSSLATNPQQADNMPVMQPMSGTSDSGQSN